MHSHARRLKKNTDGIASLTRYHKGLVIISSSERAAVLAQRQYFPAFFAAHEHRQQREREVYAKYSVRDNLATNDNLCTLGTLHLWPRSSGILLCTYVISSCCCKSGPMWCAGCVLLQIQIKGSLPWDLIYPFIIPGHLLKCSSNNTTYIRDAVLNQWLPGKINVRGKKCHV